MKSNRLFAGLFAAVLLAAGIVSCTSSGLSEQASAEEAVLTNIFARKSVRAYLDKGVEQEKIDMLLRAGMAAPSARDLRPWEFVVVTDRDALNAMAAELPYAKMLTQARYAIVVCGDTEKSSLWYMDCSAATQNILLAAEAMGLGAVWTAAYPYEDRVEVVSRNLGLPEHIQPLCVIPFGYPVTPEKSKDKYDASRIHTNTFAEK